MSVTGRIMASFQNDYHKIERIHSYSDFSSLLEIGCKAVVDRQILSNISALCFTETTWKHYGAMFVNFAILHLANCYALYKHLKKEHTSHTFVLQTPQSPGTSASHLACACTVHQIQPCCWNQYPVKKNFKETNKCQTLFSFLMRESLLIIYLKCLIKFSEMAKDCCHTLNMSMLLSLISDYVDDYDIDDTPESEKESVVNKV